MKTSNKLIFSFLGFMFVAMLVGAMIVKHKILDKAVVGDKHIIEQTKNISDFSRLDLSKKMIVHYSPGEVSSVKIKADSNLIDKIEVIVEDNTLRVRVNEVLIPSKPFEINVTGKYLDEIILNEGAQFKSVDSLKQNTLSVVCNSGSYMFLRGRFNSLTMNTQTGAVSDVEGYCNSFTIQSATGARVNADSLDVNTCKVESGTGAIANLFILKELEINANTGAMIFYKGNPEIKKTDLSSGAQLVSK